jgi:amidohydrolase family protein
MGLAAPIGAPPSPRVPSPHCADHEPRTFGTPTRMTTLAPLLLAALLLGPASVRLQEAAKPAAPQETASKEDSKPTAPPARPLLLRGATVHTMLPGDEPRVADVWILEGRIRAVGSPLASESEPVLEPVVLELAGKHLFPGLIDAHVNFDPEHDALYLAAGVTLVRDVGGDRAALGAERADERRDRVPGPNLLTAGAALDGDPPATASAVVLRNADAADSYLPYLFEEGVDFLSTLPGLPDDAWRKTIQLAHEKELEVFGPRPARLTLAEALAAGQDGFHGLDALLPPGLFWDAVLPEVLGEAAVALGASGKTIVPLLQASALRLEDQEPASGELAPARRALTALLGAEYEAWWRAELAQRRPFLGPEKRALGELVLAKQTRALRSLFEAGARLVPGSGSPQPWLLPGTALHQELARWVAAGIPSAKVLEFATRGAAEALGLRGLFGTIEVDAIANLLVLEGDASADLAQLVAPSHVVVRGKALSRADLEQRLGALAERQGALRAELSKPVELEPPPQGEEGVVVLEGTVESSSFGTRVSSERYRVVRLSGEALLFTSRIRFPASARGGERELTLEQFVRNGRLEQVHAVMTEGRATLEHDGLWTAKTWRMQTRLDGQIVSSPAPIRDQPACVEAGSVTSYLILAQLPPSEFVPVVQLHPAFDAEAVNWRVEVDAERIHRVRTNVGYRAFRLDEKGALEFGLSKVGTGVIETVTLSSSAFGGPGLPVPKAKAGAAPKAGG